MHELSIAQNILEIVRQSVPEDELEDVRVIRLKVGTFSGVVAESLDFCVSAVVAGTSLSGAKLAIDHVPFRIRCQTCEREFTNDLGYVACPECGGVETTVVSGRELQVTEIELDDHQQGTP
ncbi:MAG: hydrogenase maturation nickel metallochaperone HypA [Ignavibacteria bacterium GWA2_54_16]|nr:MAG: hydrogenase maturation nickel metallochaperone HypA [Ignavibacteria bacterium GWA2_54_16]